MSFTKTQRLCLFGLIVAAAVLAPGSEAYAIAPVIDLEPVATGLSRPVGITHAGDGSGRLFIVRSNR